MNPFLEQYKNEDDLELVNHAIEGSREALEILISKHQRFIYNLALKLVRNQEDAADLTQEVLIKVVTKLTQFKGNSSFRTWLYRITTNHFLASKRTKAENEVHSFDEFGAFISEKYNDADLSVTEQAAYEEQVIDIRNRCMASMLLCLDRQQRLVFILGAIFNLKSTAAANILDMTPENFRQQLSRAKKDLFQFMDNKCGLIDPANPCRCSKKAKGLMLDGKIDATKKTFKPGVVQTVYSQVDSKNEELSELMEGKYLDFFRQHPYMECNISADVMRFLLLDPQIIKLFHLN